MMAGEGGEQQAIAAKQSVQTAGCVRGVLTLVRVWRLEFSGGNSAHKTTCQWYFPDPREEEGASSTDEDDE